MKKKIVLGLFCFLVLCFTTACNKTSENAIKKLSVDFEKYELICVGNNLCNEVKGKMVQFSDYYASVNGERYDNIILTNDGDIYLYDPWGHKMFKTKGTTDLTHIDGTFKSHIIYHNPLIYQGDKYYSIEEDGTIKEFKFSSDADTMISHDNSPSFVVDKNGTLQLYVPCSKYKNNLDADKCPTDDTWVKFSPADNSLFKNFKVKYANDKVLVTAEGKMYSSSVLYMYSWDFEKSTYWEYSEGFFNDSLLISNLKNIWYWSDSSSSYASDLIVQTSDGNLHYTRGFFTSNNEFNETITFNEEVKNILYSGSSYYFLIIGKDNVYFANKDFDGNRIITKYDELKKYKNDIRSFYMRSGVAYVLLSDGNLYKIFEL